MPMDQHSEVVVRKQGGAIGLKVRLAPTTVKSPLQKLLSVSAGLRALATKWQSTAPNPRL